MPRQPDTTRPADTARPAGPGHPADTARQPTLASSCARAATAAEARFRITGPEPAPRASRVIALDERAGGLVRGLAGQPWAGGHFLTFGSVLPAGSRGRDRADATLRLAGGGEVLLSQELGDADVVVMIATGEGRADAAAIIGDACAERRIMTAGLVVAGPGEAAGVVPALRPNAMVLVVLASGDDIAGVLSALRV
jgi:hypothetical protein